jgi:NAD(P)-dependent dehydrogenase (short-subunit alcohol dehydrogenase family)
MGELRFDERVAVVTGAGRGIGRSHALLLAAKGAKVVVADHGVAVDGSGSSEGPADDVVAEIEAAGGTATSCYGDVADEAGASSIIQTALDTYGRLDVLVNNAGISDPALFEDLTVDQFRRMVDVHFFGTLLCTRAAWPHMKEAGYGRIVCTMSESVFGGIRDLTSYASGKGAVLGLMRTLATEAHGTGILVNAVVPRAFTRMSAAHALEGRSPEELAQFEKMLAPEMNSPAAVFLAHESCPLNGEMLRAGMGSVARLAIIHTQGVTKPDLTVEDIAENLDAILDVTDATVTSSTPFAY